MEEKDIELQQEETPVKEEPPKSMWQQTKESWYDKVNLSVKQLDIIIGLGIGGLVLTFICIALDAMGII